MHRSHKIALAFASVASMAAALAAPHVASAQPYDERQVYQDRCQEQRAGHTLLGAVLGGVAGAVIGNQVSHGDGTAWGGVAGAAVGAGIGNAADCDPNRRYGDDYYGRGSRYGYDYGRGDQYGYDYGRSDQYGDRYDRGDAYSYRDPDYYRGPEGYQGDPNGYAYDEPSYGYDDPY